MRQLHYFQYVQLKYTKGDNVYLLEHNVCNIRKLVTLNFNFFIYCFLILCYKYILNIKVKKGF